MPEFRGYEPEGLKPRYQFETTYDDYMAEQGD